MTTKLWNDGAIGALVTAGDWTPAGTPTSGDLLVMQNGEGPRASVATVTGHQLASVTLYMAGNDPVGGSTCQPVLIARDGADINVVVTDFANGIDLTDLGHPPISHPGRAPAFGTVDVQGHDQVNVSAVGEADVFSSVATVNLADGARMTGSLAASGNGSITVNAGNGAVFANQHSVLGENGVVTINANVVGSGDVSLGFLSLLTLNGSVGHGQTLNDDGGTLLINAPDRFHGLVDFTATGASGDEVALQGLHASSWSYQNDMLALWSGNHQVFDLRLASTGSFAVVQGSAGIDIVSAGASVPGTVLPQHQLV